MFLCSRVCCQVELEMREILSHFNYDGDNTPVVIGSALCALEVHSVVPAHTLLFSFLHPHSHASHNHRSSFSLMFFTSFVMFESPFSPSPPLPPPQGRQPELGKDSIIKLLEQVDSWIPTPTRDLDKPFLMPIEDVFSIVGRGTVTTGRVERGVMKKGDEAEIIGLNSKLKTTITGL